MKEINYKNKYIQEKLKHQKILIGGNLKEIKENINFVIKYGYIEEYIENGTQKELINSIYDSTNKKIKDDFHNILLNNTDNVNSLHDSLKIFMDNDKINYCKQIENYLNNLLEGNITVNEYLKNKIIEIAKIDDKVYKQHNVINLKNFNSDLKIENLKNVLINLLMYILSIKKEFTIKDLPIKYLTKSPIFNDTDLITKSLGGDTNSKVVKKEGFFIKKSINDKNYSVFIKEILFLYLVSLLKINDGYGEIKNIYAIEKKLEFSFTPNKGETFESFLVNNITIKTSIDIINKTKIILNNIQNHLIEFNKKFQENGYCFQHGDLHPGNIFVNNNISFIDFGMANIVNLSEKECGGKDLENLQKKINNSTNKTRNSTSVLEKSFLGSLTHLVPLNPLKKSYPNRWIDFDFIFHMNEHIDEMSLNLCNNSIKNGDSLDTIQKNCNK